jgi:hypothetical protein
MRRRTYKPTASRVTIARFIVAKSSESYIGDHTTTRTRRALDQQPAVTTNP